MALESSLIFGQSEIAQTGVDVDKSRDIQNASMRFGFIGALCSFHVVRSKSIYAKLQVTNRSADTVEALRRGIIDSV